MGRPKKYATAAERQAAYRASYALKSVRLIPETAATIEELAKMLDVPETEVLNSLINFALLNRNWHTLGLFGKRLPRKSNPDDLEGTDDGNR